MLVLHARYIQYLMTCIVPAFGSMIFKSTQSDMHVEYVLACHIWPHRSVYAVSGFPAHALGPRDT